MKDMKKTLLRAGICLSLFIGVFATDAGAQTVDYSAAKVMRIQGLYVFVDCEPVAAYDFLGSVEHNQGSFKSPQYQPVRDALIKKIKEEYLEATGVILHLNPAAKDKADAIKFK